VDWIFVLSGLALLILGGDGLVRGASGVALAARVTPALVGLTIVAAGTSMPELVVSVQSAWAGAPGMAVGNAVGSNIFNICAIIGLAALVRPLRVAQDTLRIEWPVMLIAAIALLKFALDGTIKRWEGGVLFGAMVLFLGYLVRNARKPATGGAAPDEEEMATASMGATGRRAFVYNMLAITGGAGILALGSTLLVGGATSIATTFGITDTVVGLTIVAAGTSTPELVTSLVASRRGRDDIAVANVVGSNIFNIFIVLGATSVVLPLRIPPSILAFDIWWMIAASVLLLPIMWRGMNVSRAEGALLFAAFIAYISLVIRFA